MPSSHNGKRMTEVKVSRNKGVIETLWEKHLWNWYSKQKELMYVWKCREDKPKVDIFLFSAFDSCTRIFYKTDDLSEDELEPVPIADFVEPPLKFNYNTTDRPFVQENLGFRPEFVAELEVGFCVLLNGVTAEFSE
ncbi:hypothetical protein DdX_02584 [Ditylenchus destructor]|uniref:Uncharacterized protein n=1 Tax=Ditylenchus destructor TaxID=166010 RepID=A0AAD4RCD0_9BILA|nr:hypothetical protein DdX_02584 [Ditylenchus destructor]